MLEKPILQPLQYPKILHDNQVNVNATIKKHYVEDILPIICPTFGREDRGEAQENYGSSATCDVGCLQALSRRIHFGKFVAESKFQKERERFTHLIQTGDYAGIDAAITDAKVEEKVLDRLRLKARTYGTDPAFSTETGPKIDVEAVVSMYKVPDSCFPFFKLHSTHRHVSGIRHPLDQGGRGAISHATLKANMILRYE